MSERTDQLFELCRQAARRGRLAITEHDTPDVDSIVSCVLMHDLLSCAGVEARIVLPTAPDRQVLRVMPGFGVEATAFGGALCAEDALVLVDHHRPLHPGRVVACVDHHPTAFPPVYPYTQIEPGGACALMVYRLMLEAGMTPTDEQTRLTVLALYLDTIALRSAKMPKADIPWAREQAARLGMDEAWLTREGLGLRDMTLPSETLIETGKKTYAFGGRTVISSYVQTDEMTDERLSALLAAGRRALLESGAALWAFIHHDPIALRSIEYDLWPDGRMDVIDYGYLASRGKDVMPRLERMMRAGDPAQADARTEG